MFYSGTHVTSPTCFSVYIALHCIALHCIALHCIRNDNWMLCATAVLYFRTLLLHYVHMGRKIRYNTFKISLGAEAGP